MEREQRESIEEPKESQTEPERKEPELGEDDNSPGYAAEMAGVDYSGSEFPP